MQVRSSAQCLGPTEALSKQLLLFLNSCFTLCKWVLREQGEGLMCGV